MNARLKKRSIRSCDFMKQNLILCSAFFNVADLQHFFLQQSIN